MYEWYELYILKLKKIFAAEVFEINVSIGFIQKNFDICKQSFIIDFTFH